MENPQLSQIIEKLDVIISLINAPGSTETKQESFGYSQATCDTCGAKMELKTKTSKKSGKPYQAWFCPKSSVSDPHPLKFPGR